MKSTNHALFLVSLILMAGCSHWSNSQKRLAAIGAGSLIGGIIAPSSAPKDESAASHALAGIGAGGLAAALIANFIYDSDGELIKVKADAETLKIQLDYIQNSYPTLLKESKKKSGPLETKKGSTVIRLYKIDEWVTESANKKFHRDQMIEIITDEAAQ